MTSGQVTGFAIPFLRILGTVICTHLSPPTPINALVRVRGQGKCKSSEPAKRAAPFSVNAAPYTWERLTE